MIDRRTLFGTTAAVATAVASAFGARKSSAATPAAKLENDIEIRGKLPLGRLERLPELDLESRLDFTQGFRKWSLRDFGRKSTQQINTLVKDAGLNPRPAPPMDDILAAIGDDPTVWTQVRCKTTAQQIMWRNLVDGFHSSRDAYLAELEEADTTGPGTLELDGDLDIPEYTKHAIHIQPGGYIGDPLGGYVYNYGVNVFTIDLHREDTFHRSLAEIMPTPADGAVNRVLELGCGVGQLCVALKERFPEADIWGIDVGAPMLRYAHMRAAEMGIDINLAQRLAEDTKFDNDTFDVVTAYILFHEVTTEAAKDIIAEAHRVLRPGGVFYPVDFKTYDQALPNASGRFNQWWDHVYNNEVWTEEYRDSNFGQLMRDAGFEVSDEAPKPGTFWNGLMGTKTA